MTRPLDIIVALGSVNFVLQYKSYGVGTVHLAVRGSTALSPSVSR